MTAKTLSPAVRLKQGRTKLLLDFPFFGVLILRLKDIETPSIDTMATDGVSLFYNPEFVAKLTPPELLGCLAHEVMHPALQHHTQLRAPGQRELQNELAAKIKHAMKDRGYDALDESAAIGHVSGAAGNPVEAVHQPDPQPTDPAPQPAPAPDVDQILTKMTDYMELMAS